MKSVLLVGMKRNEIVIKLSEEAEQDKIIEALEYIDDRRKK